MRPGFDLMIVTDERPDVLGRVAAALAGGQAGRVAVQLRERTLSEHALADLACALRALTRAHGAALLVNARVDLAVAVEADGVHLPEALAIAPVRARLGSGALIGASRHDTAGLARAAEEGASFATLSPVHTVPGKAAPLGIDGFAAHVRGVALPVFALGGVRARDVAALRAAGARGVAVMREVLSAADPAARTRGLLDALARGAG